MASITRSDIVLMPSRYRANFINCLSGFKSASLIGSTGTPESTSQTAAINLAIFNSVFHVGANPPLLGMVSRPHTVRRDTLENIKATGEFTINHINTGIITAAHQTSAKFAGNVSEFDATGLTPHFSDTLLAPYVAESKIKVGLRCQEMLPVNANGTIIVIGEVQEVFAPDDAIAEDGHIDLNALNGVTIGGLDSYYQTEFLARFNYATVPADKSQTKT